MAWTTQKYINLRSTQTYVTDGANQTSLNDDDVGFGAYPISVTLDSDTFNIGWVVDIPQARDRDSGADPRLAGIVFADNNGTTVRTLRINVPSGNIALRFAFGDPVNDRLYTEWAIYDDTNLLDTNVYSSTITGGQWVDANEALHTTNANWISNNTEKTYSIPSGILLIKIGSAAAQTDVTALATVGFRSVSTAASISAATPSGTLGTTTTASLGATTDQTTGTFYGVVDSAANLSGVTASQVKAGQKASGAAALSSGNSSVSTTTPSIAITGLSAGTLYSYAVIQNNANGDSNMLTGTFTTAAILPNPGVRQYGLQGSMRTIIGL